MPEYIEREVACADSFTVQTREYGNIDVVSIEQLTSIPTVKIKSIDNVAVLGLERHNIKRAYPDFTDREVAAYKMGFEECRTSILEVVMKYCPDDDGTCSKLTADLRELLDDIENI